MYASALLLCDKFYKERIMQFNNKSSLDSNPIKSLLDILYHKANNNDKSLQPEIESIVKNEYNGILNDINLIPILNKAYMAVSPEVGRIIYSLIRINKPKLVVEFGTSMGISAIHIASALKDNGFGKLITTELNENKINQAKENISQAHLNDLVEFRLGDALKILSNISNIDILILDGWKELYLPLLKQLEDKLSKNCLIIADDINLMPEVLAEYLNYVRNPDSGYTSCTINLDDGLELSFR